MRLPFFKKRDKSEPKSSFAEASVWIEAFGKGDDSGLEMGIASKWDKDNGSTATVFQLAQSAWAKRLESLMERTQRDVQYAQSDLGLVTAMNTLRSSIPPLLKFASWNAFVGEPHDILIENLERTLQKFMEDLQHHLHRLPNPSQALLGEVKNILSALPRLVGKTAEQFPDGNSSHETTTTKKRNILFPV